ncbi:hypothetical protein GCM10019991_26730 [Enterococcus casseliflavus]
MKIQQEDLKVDSHFNSTCLFISKYNPHRANVTFPPRAMRIIDPHNDPQTLNTF